MTERASVRLSVGSLRPSICGTINMETPPECLASLKDETVKNKCFLSEMCVYKGEDKTGQFSASLVYLMQE